MERPRTEQLLFFSPVENPPFVYLFFTSQIFKIYCIRVARTKSPHRASTRAGHVLTGLQLLYGSPPRRGESEPSSGTSYLPTGSQMLDAWISFLRHSPGQFPEGNLVTYIYTRICKSCLSVSSVCLSVCPSVCLSARPSVRPSICLCLSVCLPVCVYYISLSR